MKQMTKAQQKEIELALEAAEMSDSGEAFEALFARLRDMPESAQTNYYMGLCCYLNPDREEFRLLQAQQQFQEALKADPGLTDAILYLGHIHYDLHEYGRALNHFNQILNHEKAVDAIIDQGRLWRLVNLFELVAVSALELGRRTSFHEFYFQWKIFYYQSIRQADNFYFPKELVVHIASYLKAHGDSLSIENERLFQAVSLDLMGLIRGGDGFEEIYRKEYETLKNWKGQHTSNKISV